MKALVTLAFVISSWAQATEIHWWKIESAFSYRDLTLFCDTTKIPSTLYLSAEVEGTTITRASIRNNISGFLVQTTPLSQKEVGNLRLVRGTDGFLWIGSALLEARTLTWLFFHSPGGMLECRPSSRLATLGPNSFAFEFTGVSPEDGVVTASTSNVGKFHGKLDNGGAYQASLWFSQKRLR